ncbi:excisionase family DNA-binding protein [Sphingomonas sp. ID1715]|uniref:excisionase family DNA-binding protein n=1 Tax=Sphingomonas sp. ID1715 TaxID=1656898 RepID=UPI0014884DFB|nr:excisionase family DNA-binding protein [Sphingomonas sp. ID1715]NNM78028.1 excisionase family DNA-binding protein [Sphingomonas sp. ID1715]
MSALAINLEEVHEPSVEEIDAARIAARQLSQLNRGNRPLSFVARREDGETTEPAEPISLPANIFRVIVNMLVEMGNGNAVAVVPVTAELTTQQAADLLNISRPHLIKLLEREELPYRMVGTHRKLPAKAVLAYRDKTIFSRRQALGRMVALDEELGLYDDEQVGTRD